MNDPIWPVFEVIRYFINVMLMIRSNVDFFLFVCLFFVCLFVLLFFFVVVVLFCFVFCFFVFVCLFLFCFFFNKQGDVTLRQMIRSDDLLNIDTIYFDQLVDRIYPTELQLNKIKSGTFFGFESMYIKWYSFHQNL